MSPESEHLRRGINFVKRVRPGLGEALDKGSGLVGHVSKRVPYIRQVTGKDLDGLFNNFYKPPGAFMPFRMMKDGFKLGRELGRREKRGRR